MTIIYLTDTHIDEASPRENGADTRKNFEAVLKDITALNPDRVIFGGDIAEVSSYGYFFGWMQQFPNLDIVLGNHDKNHPVDEFFPNPIRESEDGFYYKREDENFLWLFLDSSTDLISPSQLEWLKGSLSTSTKDIMLFIHHPLLHINSVVDKKYPLYNRDLVLELLFAHQKPVTIFCGHCHVEDFQRSGNVTQYMTPAVSYQIKKGTREVESDVSYFGYRLIELTSGSFSTEVRNIKS